METEGRGRENKKKLSKRRGKKRKWIRTKEKEKG